MRKTSEGIHDGQLPATHHWPTVSQQFYPPLANSQPTVLLKEQHHGVLLKTLTTGGNAP